MESKQTRKPLRLDPPRHGTNLGVRANVRFIRMTQFRPRRNVWPRRRRLVVPRFDYDRGRRIHTRYQALQIHDPLPPALIAHSLARARVYVLVRFDRTRCLQGAVAWRCRAGRSGVAKIGRREDGEGEGVVDRYSHGGVVRLPRWRHRAGESANPWADVSTKPSQERVRGDGRET